MSNENNKITMSKYPFIYLNHGAINPESIGKNEEIFIWFKREVTKKEQKKIIKNCPPPLNCVLCWGKEFLYFGSGGDTYDFEIMQTYASEESMAFNQLEDMEEEEMEEYLAETDFESTYETAMQKAIPIYTKALEDWIMEVHEIVPIVFFNAPNNPEEQDDWAVWSEEHLYNATLPYIKNYKEKYPQIFECENEELRFFGYIFNFLCHYIKTENRVLAEVLSEIEFCFDLDGIDSAFDRLNMEDSQLQGNANMLLKVLSHLSKEERVMHISKLKPYTQFAYYASYASSQNNDILANEKPIELLQKLIKDLPPSKKDIISTYLRFAGENLVRIGPGFSKRKDTTHAGLAAEILELSLLYGDSKETFINCAAFYDWQKDYKSMLRVSLEGLKKFKNNNVLITNILYSAEKCGEKDIVAQYVHKKTADPMMMANQSYSLVTSGKLKEANDLLLGHFKKQGEFNEYSLNNLLYLCNNYQLPEKKLLDEILELSINNLKNNASYRKLPDFANNLVILMNNLTKFKDVIELCIEYRNLGAYITCSLYCGYTYAASMLGDKTIIKTALDEATAALAKYSDEFKLDTASYPILNGNIAGLNALLGNKEKMLEALKKTKKIHPDFQVLKADNDFKEYWDDKDFLKLFK